MLYTQYRKLVWGDLVIAIQSTEWQRVNFDGGQTTGLAHRKQEIYQKG